MKRILRTSSLVILLSSALANAETMEINHSKVEGIYLGGALGVSNFDVKTNDANPHENQVFESRQRSDTAFKLYMGYQFNDIVGVEGGYINYGKFDFNKYSLAIKPESAFVAVNLGYSIDGVRPFGLIGMSAVHFTEDTTSNLLASHSNSLGLHLGLGVEYTPEVLLGWSVRVAYEIDVFTLKTKSKITDDQLTNLGIASLGIAYKF